MNQLYQNRRSFLKSAVLGVAAYTVIPRPFAKREKITPLPNAVKRIAKVQNCNNISISTAKEKLLTEIDVENDFMFVAAPIPSCSKTSFVVLEEKQQLLIVVRLFDCPSIEGNDLTSSSDIEILFDCIGDRMGFVQYIFSPNKTIFINDFSPYPEAKSSKWKLPKVLKWDFESHYTGKDKNPKSDWLWVWFDSSEIFRNDDVVGFNICRSDDRRLEYSSWNFAAGNGFPDSQSLGYLVRNKARLPVLKQPNYSYSTQFTINICNDPPDIVMVEPYTPTLLDAEMKKLHEWGIRRTDWIDNTNIPAFWEQPRWKRNYQKTIELCGDLFTEAAKAARRYGIEFISILKPFDLSIHAFTLSHQLPGVLKSWDNTLFTAPPEMEGEDDAFLQSNPAWRKNTSYPIRRIRFYSNNEIPEIKASELLLSISSDNQHYTPLTTTSFSVSVDRVLRPHRRWAPDGIHTEEGFFENWALEINGIDCNMPFLKIECLQPDLTFTNKTFLFIEADDASGDLAPIEISQRLETNGEHFLFHPGWHSWNNHNEKIVNAATFTLNPLCIAFIDPPCIPGLLEPTHPDAQKIWINRVQAMLDRGTDAISLRFLCHHNHAISWLKYSFGPTVIKAFQSDYGRLPEASESDYRKIRLIRGKAVTDFLREVRKRCRKNGQKIIFQIESGAELPLETGNRMQIYFDYETWLKENLVDEFHVRSITGWCPWLREYLLPLAKKHNVKVCLISRNLPNGLDAFAVSTFDCIVKDAREAGYDGFTFYESAGLYELNSNGSIAAKGFAEPAIQAAVRRANNATYS